MSNASFGQARTPRARKPHYCAWCHVTIEVGERHFYFFGRWEGELQDWRMHLECEDAHQRETYEGEICENRHDRARTCDEMESERRKLAKELGEEIQERLSKCVNSPNEMVYTSIGTTLIDLTEQWLDEELERVKKLREDAKRVEKPVEAS